MTDLVDNSSLLEGMSNVSICLKKTMKRNDYIDWEEYFMAIACLVSNRSKDPSTQVGACIVNARNRIVGQGYNGMPRGCSDDDFPWDKKSEDPLRTKYFYVCHAEMNAIFNKNCADLSGCKIYTILFPCNQCTKTIIQSNITEVVYMSDKNKNHVEAIASMRMLDASGISYRQFIPSCEGYTIDFRKGVCEQGIPDGIHCDLGFRDVSKKRENCISWDDYFSAMSVLVAKRSKCPALQLGACIVNEDKCIVGVGYNGMPHGCSDDDFPWGTDSENLLENKFQYECHAELNAILNTGLRLKGCVMYTITFPCNECAKAIIQSGIKEVIYIKSLNDDPELEAAHKMFTAARIICRQHTPADDAIFVDFTRISIR